MTGKTKVTNSIKAFNNSFLNSALSAFFYLLLAIAILTFPKIIGYLKQIDLQYDVCIVNAVAAGNYGEAFIWMLLLTIGFVSIVIFVYKSALTIWLMNDYELEPAFKKAIDELVTILKLLVVVAIIQAIPYAFSEITQQHCTYKILFTNNVEQKDYLVIFLLMFLEGASLACMIIAIFRTVKVFDYLIFKYTITAFKKNSIPKEVCEEYIKEQAAQTVDTEVQAETNARHIWSETIQPTNDTDKEE